MCLCVLEPVHTPGCSAMPGACPPPGFCAMPGVGGKVRVLALSANPPAKNSEANIPSARCTDIRYYSDKNRYYTLS